MEDENFVVCFSVVKELIHVVSFDGISFGRSDTTVPRCDIGFVLNYCCLVFVNFETVSLLVV